MVGCNNNKEFASDVIKCDMDKGVNIHESGVIRSMDIVQFQDSNVVMTNIAKVSAMDTVLYLLDMDANKVYLFSRTGNHIKTISNQGHASNEYLSISDMFIDEKKQTLNILSRLNRKLYIYDSNGEKLLDIVDLPKTFCKMERINGGYVGYMGNYSEDKKQPYNYWILDDNFIIKGYFGEINKFTESRSSRSFMPFGKCDDNLLVLSEMNRNVYLLKGNEDNPTSKYIYDFGRFNMPDLDNVDFKNDEIRFKLQNSYIANPLQIQETKGYILALVLHEGQKKIVSYKKSNKEVSVLNLEANTGEYLMNFGNVVSMNDKELYSFVEASHVFDIWTGYNQYNNFEEKYPVQIKNLRMKFKTVKSDGNPYMIVYKLN